MSQELHATGRLTPSIDSAHFRTVLGHFGSGVAIITSIDGDEPVGMAVQSFSSLSLDPPYVMFAPAKTSTSWPRVCAPRDSGPTSLARSSDSTTSAYAATATALLDWRPPMKCHRSPRSAHSAALASASW